MFSARLKKLRKDICISQEDLAKKLGTAASTVGMWEQGRRMPDSDTLTLIADLFDVSTDYLLCRTNLRENFKADKLKQLRGNLSIEEFAAKLNISTDALEHYEEGKAIPTQTIVEYIAEVCGVDYGFFFNNSLKSSVLDFYTEDIRKWITSKDSKEYIEFIYNISKQGVTKEMLSRAELKITIGKQ